VPVTAVAFDFGGVLALPPLAGLGAYAATLGLPADAVGRYFRGDPQIARLEVGAITSREFFKYVCTSIEDAHGVRVDIHALGDAAGTAEELRPEMLDLVDEVRATCATALLTNNVREARWRATFPFDRFDVVVDSSEVGVRKPDPAAYALLVERLDRPPHEIAFVDDFEENLAPATTLGIVPILFSDPRQCRAALADLGVVEGALR
jgi:epoxide hydrolase-like predicted phosphatase